MELETAKGVRDFPPQEKIMRDKIIAKITSTFQLYGFSPLETPVLERLDVLSAKYAGGEEILKEMFKLKDQGERELCLRYDLTVPLARFVGMNPTLKLPFKRYQVGNAFRDGPIKLGRYREFIQCDIDIVGSKSMLADSQIITVVKHVFQVLELKIIIEVNNRKVLDGILFYANVPEDKWLSTILIIDKLKKIGKEGVSKELQLLGLNIESITKILETLSISGTNKQIIKQLKELLSKNDQNGQNDNKNVNKIGAEGMQEIEQLFDFCTAKNVIFSPSLARGLSYYTGTVFEAFAPKSKISSSLAAGGRYDKMIGNFLENKQEYPTVGIAFGIEPIIEVWKENNPKAIEQKTVTQVYIIPIKTTKECITIADDLRKQGIPTDMDINERGISKNLDYANAYAIPFVLFVGNEELKQKKVKLKEMISGKEELLSIEQVVKKLIHLKTTG